jgi:hypothetical protein
MRGPVPGDPVGRLSEGFWTPAEVPDLLDERPVARLSVTTGRGSFSQLKAARRS